MSPLNLNDIYSNIYIIPGLSVDGVRKKTPVPVYSFVAHCSFILLFFLQTYIGSTSFILV